jgi:biopolymer transport protein ExbD
MTPMIDVVFLLIIFFLVSSHLARQENRLPLDLPIASSYGPTDPERAALTISVDAKADCRIAGKVVDSASLAEILRDHRERQGLTASIRIRTDRGVQYRYVEPILREAARAGVTDATIAVREQDR